MKARNGPLSSMSLVLILLACLLLSAAVSIAAPTIPLTVIVAPTIDAMSTIDMIREVELC